MIKLVVSDMDGTLLRDDLTLSKKNIDAIKKIREKGIHFAFATGRPDQLMREYVDIVQLKEPIIMANGSIVGNPFQVERVFEKGIDKFVVDNIIHYLEEKNMTYMVYTKEAIYCKDNERYRLFKKRNETLSANRRSLFIATEHPKDLIEDDQVVYKILVIEQNQELYNSAYTYFNNLDDIVVFQSHVKFIDINPANTDKGKGLKMLADYYGIDMSEIVAFGDQQNDINMIKEVGIGVAMQNAIPELKAVANDITLSNMEDGFAHWVEKNILNTDSQ
jgi:Cof subfamily protein (haloacid dehalogenase superfamily)